VLVALNEHGVAASKAPDPSAEGRFAVSVPQGDLASAVTTLSQEGLPSPVSPGVLESLGETGLVASRKAEHARLVVGTAGELERSLTEVAGVLSARVHLAVPEPDPFAPREAVVPTSASVLIRHQGATPPLGASDVQRLVAGAVSGLDPEHVAVVNLPVAGSPREVNGSLAQFGPLSVSHGSISALRIIVVAVAALNLALLGTLIFLWLRLRSSRSLPVRAANPAK